MKKKALIFLLWILINSLSLPFVHALDYEIVDTWSGSDGGRGYSYQQNGFKFNGTFWEFYVDPDDGELHYRYRQTNDTWIEPTNSPVTNATDTLEEIEENTDFSVFFDNSTAHRVYLAYVIYDTHVLYESQGYDKLYFRRGQINDFNITWDSRSLIHTYSVFFGTFKYPDVCCNINGYPYVSYELSTYDSYSQITSNDARDGSGSWSTTYLESEGAANDYFGALVQLPNLDMGLLISDFPDERSIFLWLWNNSLSTWQYKGRPATSINLGYDFDGVCISDVLYIAYTNTSRVCQSTGFNLTSQTFLTNRTITSSTAPVYPSLTNCNNSALKCFYVTKSKIYESQLSTTWDGPDLLINAFGIYPGFFGSHYNTSSTNYNDIGISWVHGAPEELRFFIYGGYVPPQVGLLPIMFILGMVGLGSMFYGGLMGVYQIKKKNYREGFITGAIMIAIGMSLFFSWLWSA